MAEQEKTEPMSERESLALIASSLSAIANDVRQIHFAVKDLNDKTPAPKSNLLG
jgi:hypothetical protein